MIYETLGYNRWPRQWPEHFPLSWRWPLSAPMTGAWPYEWQGFLADWDSLQPKTWPVNIVAGFQNFQDGFSNWQIVRSPVGPGTATRMTRNIRGEYGEPEGIDTQWEFFGPDTTRWRALTQFTPYPQPYRFNVSYQTSSLTLQIFDLANDNRPAARYILGTTKACQEIDLSVESGN